jgi:hypothetical protein
MHSFGGFLARKKLVKLLDHQTTLARKWWWALYDVPGGRVAIQV